jgi:hypothetical protein
VSTDAQQIPHDKPEQLQAILAGLIAGEQVYAVYDCHGGGTGFVAVTSLRVVFQDNSFLGGKSAVTSLPIRSIQSVSFLSDKSMFGKFSSSATVVISAGQASVEATFRGNDKAKHIHDTILWLISR